jgi:hypothetical protein
MGPPRRLDGAWAFQICSKLPRSYMILTITLGRLASMTLRERSRSAPDTVLTESDGLHKRSAPHLALSPTPSVLLTASSL